MADDKPEFYDGTNVFLLPNGDTYLGEYCAHISGKIWREGHGVYHSADGQFYEGEWKDDKLIDNTEVTITYVDKSVYNGSLLKSKYDGPGSYTFENGIKLFFNCTANIPIGNVIMADVDGRLWRGVVVGNRVNLSPENLFFKNIHELRGVSKKRLKKIEPEWSPTPEPSVRSGDLIPTITDKDLEKIIFAKSTKTDAKTDFADSDWYRKFADYKNKREVILEKVKKHEKLDKEEAAWYANYAKYRKMNRIQKLFTERSDKVDVSLLDKFYSKEESCKPYSIIYPSYDWRLPPESKSSFVVEQEEDSSGFEEDLNMCVEMEEEVEEEVNLEDSDISEELDTGGRTVGIGTDSLYSFMDAIAGKMRLRSCKWSDSGSLEVQEVKMKSCINNENDV